MKKQLSVFLVAVVGLAMMSCSMTGVGKEEVQAPLVPVSCIVVLPAGTIVDREKKIDYESARALERGAAFTTSVLKQQLGDNPKVRFVDENQLSSLVSEVSGGMSGTVSVIGRKLNCEAVLTTQVKQFEERQGTEYAVDSPASASVTMVLRHAEKGTVLW